MYAPEKVDFELILWLEGIHCRFTADESDEALLLTSKFMEFVNKAEVSSWPHERKKPSALLSPTTVVKTVVSNTSFIHNHCALIFSSSMQMDSLMRNDWPEEGSGIKTAFSFTMPMGIQDYLAGQVNQSADDGRPSVRPSVASGSIFTFRIARFVRSRVRSRRS